MPLKKQSISLFVAILTIYSCIAQQHSDPKYIKVTEERAAKIVAKLELSNADKEKAVTGIIAKQYQNLSKIHDERDAQIKEIKSSNLEKEKQSKNIEKHKAKADKSLDKLHKAYLKTLAKHLDRDQIDAVKDGMTYGVVPKTYVAFQDMLPNLTEEQKRFIYNNLVEAREHAMDAGSSKEKHAWFGKYKGRINNYLSTQGYDLNKESEAWHKRIEARKKAKK